MCPNCLLLTCPDNFSTSPRPTTSIMPRNVSPSTVRNGINRIFAEVEKEKKRDTSLNILLTILTAMSQCVTEPLLFGGAIRDSFMKAMVRDYDVCVPVGTNDALNNVQKICKKLAKSGFKKIDVMTDGYAGCTYGQLICVVKGIFKPDNSTDDGITVDLVFVTSSNQVGYDFTINSLAMTQFGSVFRRDTKLDASKSIMMISEVMHHIHNRLLVPISFVEHIDNIKECIAAALSILARLQKFTNMFRVTMRKHLPGSPLVTRMLTVEEIDDLGDEWFVDERQPVWTLADKEGVYNVAIDQAQLKKFPEGDRCPVCHDPHNTIAVTLHTTESGIRHMLCPSCIIHLKAEPGFDNRCPCCRHPDVFKDMAVPDGVIISEPVEGQPKYAKYPPQFVNHAVPAVDDEEELEDDGMRAIHDPNTVHNGWGAYGTWETP